MAYFVIEGVPVFIPAKSLEELVNACTSSPEERVASMFSERESSAVETKIFDHLHKEFLADKQLFDQKRTRFNFAGEAAQNNVWDLLFDYCSLSGNAVLKDFRKFEEKLFDSHAGLDYEFPMGTGFGLEVKITSHKKRSLFRKASGNNFTVLILISEVEQLVGDLSAFSLKTKGFRLSCGKNISLMNRS